LEQGSAAYPLARNSPAECAGSTGRSGHGQIPGGGIRRFLQNLAPQTKVVFKRSAVFIRAMVVHRIEKVPDQRRIMGGTDIGPVMTCLPGPMNGALVTAAEVLDVLFVHRLGLHRVLRFEDTHGGPPEHRRAGIHVARADAGMGQFNCGQAAVFPDPFQQERVGFRIRIVPEFLNEQVLDIRGWVDLG